MSTDPALSLPTVIEAYLAAHQLRDADAAALLLAPEIVVADDGRTYRGVDEVRGWIAKAASEFEYTSTLTGVEQTDETHWVAVHHLAGSFPGSPVDLAYRFTLAGGLIGALAIEPL